MPELMFAMEVVGGPYDGAPALRWLDDGKHPPPEWIMVGRCRKSSPCGAQSCPRREHVAYWTPKEREAWPARAMRYEKQEEFVDRTDAGELRGRAVYAIGNLLDPRCFGEVARTPLLTPV